MTNGVEHAWGAVGAPAFVAMIRGRIGGIWRNLSAMMGRYVPLPKEEKEITCIRQIKFRGDVPVQISGGVREQGRYAFCKPRPVFEAVDDLVVTPLGGGWHDSRLHQRYSSCEPGARLLFENHSPQREVEVGYFIQSAHKDTYGDWVSEYLGALGRAEKLDAPIFLPAAIASRPYVRRDLDALGVVFESIDRPIKIRRAKVLRQQKYFVHFPPVEIQALRTFLRADPPPVRDGGLLYLSRRGEASEVATRYYPNEIIEETVKARGGRVLLTANATQEDYEQAAMETQTVIFDHGSAFYNSLQWRTQRVVEIVADAWWNNAFLMLADAMGIDDYTIIRGSMGDAHIVDALNAALDRPIKT